MMKTMKRLLAGAAVAASLFSLAAPASATLTNWFINTNGTGSGSAVSVHDYLALSGNSLVQPTYATLPPTAGDTFTFNEVGSFLVQNADGITPLNPNLSATFVGSGSGTVGGNLGFTPGGILDVFSGGSTPIATFTLVSGSALLDAPGGVLPNGVISLIFQATAMQSGYFFDSSKTDLSTLIGSPLFFGFATTNAIPGDPTNPAYPVLESMYATQFGSFLRTPTTLDISNGGQFRLAVPEPSMLSLFGLALLGLGFMTRRKFKS